MLFKVIKFVRACLFHYLCSRFYYINNKKLYEKDFAQCLEREVLIVHNHIVLALFLC